MSILEGKEKICVFTGHRDLSDDFHPNGLRSAIRKALRAGYFTFLNGMAVGFDMLAAEILLSFKKKYPQIELIACIPCAVQDKYFSQQDKARYARLLKACDGQILLSEHYFNGCMQARDRYMAEQASLMIAYCTRNTGGTAYTVRCFEKLHPDCEIIRV